jgi:hypothetical protein
MQTYELDEEDRQAVLLALAELALSRPGWDAMLSEIAKKLNPHQKSFFDSGLTMFENFKLTSADRVKAERGPLL